ncbi:uncharacterized protein LOC142165131 [Nicotiana tabacum]|uniref:Uncharacterized protein LOC142165131 n=1 Tax=Nicotiana tabacum TaxID=4097 RepID=A0AC58S4E4_TOBAC
MSSLKAQLMVEKRCLAYLAFVRDVSADTLTIDLVPTVRNFPDVFLADLLGMSPDRDIDIGGFSSTVTPFPKLTQMDALFRWSNECEESFQKLKTSLTTASVLVLPSGSVLYNVYYDASRVGFSFMWIQDSRVTAYTLRQLNPHEKNYPVHDIEENDMNFEAAKVVELLKDYDITILYYPGKANVLANALRRKAEITGSLAFISAMERPWAMDIQALANRLVILDISL